MIHTHTHTYIFFKQAKLSFDFFSILWTELDNSQIKQVSYQVFELRNRINSLTYTEYSPRADNQQKLTNREMCAEPLRVKN